MKRSVAVLFIQQITFFHFTKIEPEIYYVLTTVIQSRQNQKRKRCEVAVEAPVNTANTEDLIFQNSTLSNFHILVQLFKIIKKYTILYSYTNSP